MAELKPCPFCGHKAVIDDCGDNRYFVRCSHCSINQDKLYAQKCDAVKAWNRRADKVPPVVHGHWNDNDTCSVCGDEPLFEYDVRILNFCPNCGADMRGNNDG